MCMCSGANRPNSHPTMCAYAALNTVLGKGVGGGGERQMHRANAMFWDPLRHLKSDMGQYPGEQGWGDCSAPPQELSWGNSNAQSTQEPDEVAPVSVH